MNRVVTVFCFMVQGMTVGITGNDCLHNRGPTGGQCYTVKNCVHYRELVCSVDALNCLSKIYLVYGLTLRHIMEGIFFVKPQLNDALNSA